MLYYGKNDLSKGIDPTKCSNSKECRYWFFNHGFKFQDSACNGCHDLTIFCLNISDIATSTVKKLSIVVLLITLANLN